MKLHEKILVHYLSSNSPVDKEGHLYKKGERNTSYQRRWFVLKGNMLFYLDRRGGEPLGVIVLEGCSVQLCESEEQFAFALVFPGPGLRTYKLAAEDQANQESWIKALLAASHSFLSVLVNDLEKQYEDAKRAAYSEGKYKRSTVIGSDAEMLTESLADLDIVPFSAPAVREGRSYSTNHLHALPPSTKPAKKSPKLWPKRNAHVTPLNEPLPPSGGGARASQDWFAVGAETLADFSELHELYGREVRELQANWQRKWAGQGGDREGEKQEVVSDLIDLG
ncbi:sesquipedalian-1 [Amia ocellicauda]|uniref:sesquipedalian-1 n=1 Tax=Amia ocellicauda TaxID=2972642 RepID=UPI0034647E48